MFFKQTILVYVAFLLVPVVTFVLDRTTFRISPRLWREPCGRRQRRCQRRPHPLVHGAHRLHARRWPVPRLLLYDGIFQENLTQSEGFIAVALVYFGAWRPTGVMGCSVFTPRDRRRPGMEVPWHYRSAPPILPQLRPRSSRSWPF